MTVLEIVSSGDRRSLVERFNRKSKQQAISELIDIHLAHCTRTERLEAENETLRKTIETLESTLDAKTEGHDLRAQLIKKQNEQIELLNGNAELLRHNLALAKQAPLCSTRRNAERYRFLRERVLSACRDIDDRGKGMLGVLFKISGDEWLGCDASIDAAMAQAVLT